MHFFLLYTLFRPPALHSFPTRRSSDLAVELTITVQVPAAEVDPVVHVPPVIEPTPDSVAAIATPAAGLQPVPSLDRKSTRLNSSHSQISYAVFCLKKKKECVKNELLDV